MSKDYKYAIITGDEDGDPVHYLDNNEENDINLLMENHSVKRWVEQYDDPNYWEEGDAMLVKIQCINPTPIETVTEWKLNDE